jgi:transposase
MRRGKQPKLSASQRNHLLELHDAGTHTQEELAERFSVSRTTVYRELQRRAGTASS